MDKFLVLSILIVCFCKYETNSLNLPGPLVYVVTPSPRPPRAEAGRAAPFYYHNWMRRMDPPRNTTTTSTTPKTETPDLIFAEFESGNDMKSIRKLLEKEKIERKTSTTTSTTSKPIYVAEESKDVNYAPTMQVNEKEKNETKPVDMTDYFALYNNLYNPNSEALAPVYRPPTASTSSTTTRTTTSSLAPNVENIWHIIDSQKYDQHPGQWEEVPLTNDNVKTTTSEPEPQEDDDGETEGPGLEEIDENFALPGFATNPGNGAENESRAIRTEQNMHFPYISLKPFQVKTQKKPPVNKISNSKKGNNMYTSIDNFYDIKNPVRGEAQDVVMMRQPIDRYNPAQPYLPDYGTKSKQSSLSAPPTKAVANLAPPPPPPPPRISDGNFPVPSSYESFPPYAPSSPPATPPLPPPPAPKPMVFYQPSIDTSDDSGPDPGSSDSDGSPIDLGYRYKPPSSPAQAFVPTVPPLTKPLGGYSYDKPQMSKPFSGYSYDKPPMTDDLPLDNTDDKPDLHGYHYNKPEAPPSPSQDHPPDSYGHDAPSYGSDYPDLIFDKPHGGMKGADNMKDVGMAPPPPPPDMKPGMDQDNDDQIFPNHGPSSDDHGFPQDFPGDLKFHHDFEDHDYHHYHHHHTTTTTTTTETPRVNRFSYYYLGKKLYYLPLYFSVYFIVYVGALIIKAVLRHKIVYPNSWRPNDQTASFFSKRSVDSWDLSNENLYEITRKVTHAIAVAGTKYFAQKKKK